MIIIINSRKVPLMRSPENRLNDHIKGSGLRTSSRRNAILSIMGMEKKHYTVEELYEITKKTDPGIGIATIYRTIRLFCEAGIAREIHPVNDVTRYEVITDNRHHDHLICVGCGTFVEISSDVIEKEQSRIARKHGFELTNHNLILYGICSGCANEKKSAKSTAKSTDR